MSSSLLPLFFLFLRSLLLLLTLVSTLFLTRVRSTVLRSTTRASSLVSGRSIFRTRSSSPPLSRYDHSLFDWNSVDGLQGSFWQADHWCCRRVQVLKWFLMFLFFLLLNLVCYSWIVIIVVCLLLERNEFCEYINWRRRHCSSVDRSQWSRDRDSERGRRNILLKNCYSIHESLVRDHCRVLDSLLVRRRQPWISLRCYESTPKG